MNITYVQYLEHGHIALWLLLRTNFNEASRYVSFYSTCTYE